MREPAKRGCLTFEFRKAMTAKTNAERQREYRARKVYQQTKEVRGLFAHVDDHAALKGHAVKMARKRAVLTKRLLASGVL